MPIRRLQISGVRNLQPLNLNFSPSVNFIFGQNGSGKSSLLESIHLQATGKSFRHHQIKPVIQQGKDECILFSEVEDSAFGITKIGSQRSLKGEKALKINGQNVASQSEASKLLPVQIIEPNTFKLLSGSPQERRQFIDWGVFHVEQIFLGEWKNLKKQLQQRNAVLKKGEEQWLDVWSKGFIESALKINQLRIDYLTKFKPYFEQSLAKLDPELKVELNYYPGWERKSELIDVLIKQKERDLQLGYTQSGPQRAELRIKVNGVNAADMLSRGQQKSVVAALKIAQGGLLKAETGRNTIYLVDDLASELDESHRLAFCHLLEELGSQVFITSIESDSVSSSWNPVNSKMFHVEHGQITEQK